MLLNKPLPNFLKIILLATIASASTSAMAADHGQAAEASAAQDAIEHAAKDSENILKKEGDVKVETETKSAISTDEMVKELQEKADSIKTEQ